MAQSDLDLIYVGNSKDIVMYEGAAKEITEADFNASLKFGQECCTPLIEAQKKLMASAGKKKRERTASFGRKNHWKKAIVTLKKGDNIDLA